MGFLRDLPVAWEPTNLWRFVQRAHPFHDEFSPPHLGSGSGSHGGGSLHRQGQGHAEIQCLVQVPPMTRVASPVSGFTQSSWNVSAYQGRRYGHSTGFALSRDTWFVLVNSQKSGLHPPEPYCQGLKWKSVRSRYRGPANASWPSGWHGGLHCSGIILTKLRAHDG